MQKVDWRRELKHLYRPSASKVVEVRVPEMLFLAVDGEGDPDAGPFAQALEALYAVSYALKYTVRERAAADHAVSPAEGLWGTEDSAAFDLRDQDAWKRMIANRSAWQWTLMIRQPEPVTQEMFQEARERVRERKPPPAASGLRLESFEEGLAAQILHRGTYAEEWPTISKVHHYIDERGVPVGKHHEVYLNDPRRTAPENLKTIIRQPFERAG